MKRLFGIGILLFLVFFSFPLWANPIRSTYVCVPAIKPSQAPLEFRIRETQTCGEGETLMKVQGQGDGGVILFPAPPPLSPEQNEVLENYKRYHGL